MNIKPLADRVLISPTPAEEVTMAGIIIPDSAKEKPLKGKVLAAGNGTRNEELMAQSTSSCVSLTFWQLSVNNLQKNQQSWQKR